ncbi:hypothetical protein F2Q69_00029717 [Brassica cretica]|uniref:Uncharacterized protein n=1 Tax=Brassica cretica TaxID=69181 RepID=A0A8S9S2W4_BRACR|nr:hypothetical protein F2Q69_00029717 [Brassica cretica]
MEGSPYRISFISWKGGRSLGLVPGFLLAGTWSVPLSGTREPGSCPEAGGNDTVDSAPSVSLSWVPLKPELILNPGKDWFLLIWPEPNSSVLNFMVMMRLEIVLVGENQSLRYAMESLGPETGSSRTMTKRSASSTPTMADRAGSRRRVDSPVSRSDSSPDPGEVSECDLMAPLPLAYAYASPSPVGPSSTMVEEDLVEWRRKYSLPPLSTSVYLHRRSMLPAIFRGRSPFQKLSLIPALEG